MKYKNIFNLLKFIFAVPYIKGYNLRFYEEIHKDYFYNYFKKSQMRNNRISYRYNQIIIIAL